MRISDWSSDVCSSDLVLLLQVDAGRCLRRGRRERERQRCHDEDCARMLAGLNHDWFLPNGWICRSTARRPLSTLFQLNRRGLPWSASGFCTLLFLLDQLPTTLTPPTHLIPPPPFPP